MTVAVEDVKIILDYTAAEQIKKLMTDAYDIGLRLEVIAGGCSGFQYKFSKVAETGQEENDMIIEKDGAKLFVDPMSAQKLNGCTVRFEETIMAQQFVVDNPNASATCGCGISFN